MESLKNIGLAILAAVIIRYTIGNYLRRIVKEKQQKKKQSQADDDMNHMSN